MISQALELIGGFMTNIVQKLSISRMHVAAEHEVLPDNQPEFVADVVEVIALVDSASPFADHVHIRVPGCLQNVPISFRSYPRGKTVERNDIGALSKYGNTVNHELHAASPVVGITAQLERPQPGTDLRVIYSAFLDFQRG